MKILLRVHHFINDDTASSLKYFYSYYKSRDAAKTWYLKIKPCRWQTVSQEFPTSFFSYLSGERWGDGGDSVSLQLLPRNGVRSGLPGHPALPQTAAREQPGALGPGEGLRARQRWASLCTHPSLSVARLSRCMISCSWRWRTECIFRFYPQQHQLN